MKKYLYFIVFFFLISSSTDIQAQKWLKGHWVGIGYQYNSDISTWPIDFQFKSKKEIKINYPTLECSGNFVRVSSNRHKAVFKEKIIVGKEFCYDNSIVIMTKIDANYISVAYFSPNMKDGPMATAVLERKKVNVKTLKKM